MKLHAGWSNRGYLPHYDAPGAVQHVVFRLADSLPAAVLERLAGAPASDRFAGAERALDSGAGSKALADPRIAALVQSSLRYFDVERYRLKAWCVMPNHVHVLVEQVDGWPLRDVVRGWKSVTARRANGLVGARGRFWAPDYFDRAVRDAEDPIGVANYIENNPVAAGLSAAPADWPWSSARSADDVARQTCEARFPSRR